MPLLGEVALIVDCEHKTAPETGGEAFAFSVGTRALATNSINLAACKPVDEQTYREWSRRAELRAGDIVFAREAPIGGVGLVQAGQRLCLGQRTVLIRADEERVSPNFLFNFLRSPSTQLKLEGLGTGSTVQHVNVRDVRDFKIPNLPPLRVQTGIAEILSAIDQKIAVNQSTGETLESIAQTLFRSWFVDFDPVRAKMAGEKPVGMDDATAALFPDTMEESELGDIPAGWRIGLLGDLCKLVMGQSPPGSAYNEEGIGLPFFQGRADFGERFPRRRVSSTEGKRKALAGEILVSVRAPVGDINQALEESVIGRGVAAVMHMSGSEAYSFSLLKSLGDTLEYYNGEGTVFGAINKADFSAIKLVEPPGNVIAAFDEVCSPINRQIRVLHDQTKSLVSVRDSLLPRLISGELQVPEELVA